MINKELILLDREFSDKASVFQSVADKAASLNLISDRTKFMQALFARETEFPTSIGYDVGIPHCRSSAVTKPFVSFLRSAQPIKWDQESEECVTIIFLIAIPEANENNLHLKVLSAISRKLMHESFREALTQSKSVSEVYDLLNEINTNVEKGE